MSALNRHWAKYPPVHVSVAMYLSSRETRPAAPTAAAPSGEDTIAELFSSIPQVPR